MQQLRERRALRWSNGRSTRVTESSSLRPFVAFGSAWDMRLRDGSDLAGFAVLCDRQVVDAQGAPRSASWLIRCCWRTRAISYPAPALAV